ncbi:MAG: hypothetical protein WCP86_04390 [bacterium]
MKDLDTIVESVALASAGQEYKPSAESSDMLNQALAYVQSVPYRVTLRWVEYRLLQDGTFKSKDDFLRFKGLSAKARKNFWGGWAPDTLADDTRKSIIRGQGFKSVGAWIRRVAKSGVSCNLDFWVDQPFYVEVWFEAAAMSGQFEHYTSNIVLRPFKGDASIPYKKQIAVELEQAATRYPGREIIILYFGDADPKGYQIPESAVRDIRQWCSADFRFIRAGLNPEHPDLYGISENPERPGCWQWEALDDGAAAQLITSSLAPFVDAEKMAARQAEQEHAEERLWLALHNIEATW